MLEFMSWGEAVQMQKIKDGEQDLKGQLTQNYK